MDKWNVIGDPTAKGYQVIGYSTYTATEAGVLVIASPLYISEAYVDEKSKDFNYDDNGTYNLLVPVQAGQTVTVKMSNFGMMCYKASIEHPEAGTFTLPFDLAEGENQLPAAFGDYFYSFSNGNKTGFGVFNFPATAGTKYKVFSNTWSYPDYPDFEGDAKGEVRFEMQYANMNYLILISKTDATAEAETFTFAMDAYAAGETEDNPIEIDALPAALTTPKANGTYYYKVAVPAGDSKMLISKATAATKSTCAIYEVGNTWNASDMQGGNSVVAEGGKKYIVRWTVDEAEPLAITITLDDVKQGDDITNPLQANTGDNVIPGDGTKYYTYTTARKGKLNIEGAPGMDISFPAGTGQYDGTLECVNSGVNWYLGVAEGQQIYIKVDGAKQGDKFVLTEMDWQLGESQDKPIDVENGKYIFGDKQQASVWLRYTAKADGMLDIESDLPYSYGCSFGLIAPGDEYESRLAETQPDYSTLYRGTFAVKQNDVFLVHLMLDNIYPTNFITFTEREAQNGENAATAILVNKDEQTDLLTASNSLPRWYKFYVQPGTVKIEASAYIGGELYRSEADALAGNGGEEIEMQYQYSDDYTEVTYFTSWDVTEKGIWYIKTTNTYAGSHFTLSGNVVTSGISEVKTAGRADSRAIYNIAGQRVAEPAKGLYIIGGRKVIIK